MYNIPPSDQLKMNTVSAEVRELLRGESTGHGWDHVKRVRDTAAILAYRENADGFVVSLVALLHDVDDRKVTGNPSTETDFPNARRILLTAGVDPLTAIKVCDAVATIGFRKGIFERPKRTPEAEIVSDADLLDAIGAVGIARALTYGASKQRTVFDPNIFPAVNLTPEHYASDQGTTINHFFEKLLTVKDLVATVSGKEEAARRHATMVSYLSSFFEETDAPVEWRRLLRGYRM